MDNAPAVGRYKKIRMTDGAETATRVSAVSMHDVASQIKPAFRIMVFLLPAGGRIDDFRHDMPPSFRVVFPLTPDQEGGRNHAGWSTGKKVPAGLAASRMAAHRWRHVTDMKKPLGWRLSAFFVRATKPGTVFFQCKDSIAVFSFECQENKIVLTICLTFIFNVCTI